MNQPFESILFKDLIKQIGKTVAVFKIAPYTLK